MKSKKRLLALVLACFVLFAGCSSIHIPTNANTAFSNFTRCLFMEEVASNTINLHYSLKEPKDYGIVDVPVTLGSFDLDKSVALAAVENLKSALSKFSYQTLTPENQITYDVLSYYFNTLEKNISYYLYEEPLSPITGIHSQLPILLAEYHFFDQEDVETYLSLLQTVPDYFSSLIRFEQEKSENGLFMSDSVADAVIKQCNSFLSTGDNNYLLSTFEEKLQHMTNLSDQTVAELISQNQKEINESVLPAYRQLASSLSDLKGTGKNAKGLCYFENGTDYYSFLVFSETGSDRSVKEIKTLIANQIASDLISSQTLLKKNPSISEKTNSVAESPDVILQTLEGKISNAFPSSAPVNVQVKYVPKALEPHLSPAFYLIPAIDNFTENTIYINQAYSLTDIHLFTTLAHEGYPGHLYQTTYFASTNPDPVRTILNFSGYVEGWATYAEMCSYYLSSLEKPHASLLQKNNAIILGLYACADIGIHYDGWSLEDTISYFASYGITDESEIQDIYQYIVGDPANYLTYYLGYLEILELKKDYLKNQGNAFSQKSFHQKLLELGPAPFSVIRKYMLGD